MEEKTVQDIYDSMSEEQKKILYLMVGYAVDTGISCIGFCTNMTAEQQALTKHIIDEILKRKKGSENRE